MMVVSISVDYQQAVKELGIKEKELKPILRKALEESGQQIKDDFGRITSTWQHKIEIEVLTDIKGTGVTMVAGTDDKIFGYLEYGVRPHPIFPRRKKALAFWSGFHPKSTPGHIGAGAGGVFGDRLVRAAVWNWPGIKPRHWLPKIADRARSKLTYTVKSHLQRWTK